MLMHAFDYWVYLFLTRQLNILKLYDASVTTVCHPSFIVCFFIQSNDTWTLNKTLLCNFFSLMGATGQKDCGKAGYIQEVHKRIGSSCYCVCGLDMLWGSQIHYLWCFLLAALSIELSSEYNLQKSKEHTSNLIVQSCIFTIGSMRWSNQKLQCIVRGKCKTF